jgi:flagellar basal body-associated protein FliL
MLIFESLSAGGIAVLIALAAVLVLAGIYGLVVWPFTNWDLAHVESGSWWEYALGLIFAAGATAGFWCFSGAAFREKATQQRANAASRPKYRSAR